MHGRRKYDPGLARSRSIALRVVAVFLVAGAAWILLTDILLYELVDDERLISRFETTKGWIFVALTGLLIYETVSLVVRKLARSEATIHAVLTSISDGVLVIDRSGAITSANPAAARLLGVEKPDDLVGINGAEFARRYHVGRLDGQLVAPEDFVSQRALTGEHPPPYKAVLRTPEREEVVALVTGAPVHPVAGEPPELSVSVMHDITELEQLERTRDEFISSAAHTLKTPVAIIKMYAELLHTNRPPPVVALAAIERQLDRMTRLIENLLVCARLRTESLRFAPTPVRIDDVVSSAMQEMHNASQGHTLRADVRASLLVFADRQRMTLAVRNLIELAAQRALSGTEIVVTVDEHDALANVSVSYEPMLGIDLSFTADADAGFDGLDLQRYVTSELVRAARGDFGEVATSTGCREWIELPTMKEEPHA